MTMVVAFMNAVFIYFPIYQLHTGISPNGNESNFLITEITMYFTAYVTFIFYLIINTSAHSKYTIGAVLVSVAGSVIYTNIRFRTNIQDEHYGSLDMIDEFKITYFHILVTPFICITLELVIRYTKALFYPDLIDVLRVNGSKSMQIKISSRLDEYKNKLESLYKRSTSIKQQYDSYDLNP